MDAPEQRARRLARELVERGALRDPRWRAAFEEVPREYFVPSYHAPAPGGGRERLWWQDPDPDRRRRWQRGVYTDAPLATRMREGELLSSSSQPSLMARMLERLAVHEGMRVLEVGTGTGWNAALLAHRLGDERVTTVDLDPEITEAARRHLAVAGYRPAVVTGDGARGVPARAPYDRIIATCTVPAVPRAWLAQCAPGGRILTPLATGLLRLTVHDPGHAEGRFLDVPAYFVGLRGGPPPRAEVPATGVPAEARRAESFVFLLALTAYRVPPRAAYDIWRAEGRPHRERYGVTVRGDDQWAWLDAPDGDYRWPLDG
ncbi:methyltransferase domain-containing protein [Streptomyces sp. JJ36]|uniref:methyltransferase domain-containing protein n=1 Tax=Streptomyces sp. JJ36 TaxID=2736645 RepID=UPI001F388F02|nr:methyltransferase domain-containing protein [Streptomyces sp. JJ36]MCF6525050.1 methyltransferase domain-containing protein [Streptomyces sp. JJ36]